MSIEEIAAIEEMQAADRPIVIPPPVPVSPPSKWADIKDGLFAELDSISDPFVQMVYIMLTLMPTMNEEVKEYDLRSMAYSQDALRIYSETLDKGQEAFNTISQTEWRFDPEVGKQTEELYYQFRYLEEYLALDQTLETEARDKLRGEISTLLHDWFEANNYDWQGIGERIHMLMDADSGIYTGYAPETMKELNYWMDIFHLSGVTFGAQSKAVQGLMEYDVEDYNAFANMFQTFFEKFVEQNNASIHKLNALR